MTQFKNAERQASEKASSKEKYIPGADWPT